MVIDLNFQAVGDHFTSKPANTADGVNLSTIFVLCDTVLNLIDGATLPMHITIMIPENHCCFGLLRGPSSGQLNHQALMVIDLNFLAVGDHFTSKPANTADGVNLSTIFVLCDTVLNLIDGATLPMHITIMIPENHCCFGLLRGPSSGQLNHQALMVIDLNFQAVGDHFTSKPANTATHGAYLYHFCCVQQDVLLRMKMFRW